MFPVPSAILDWCSDAAHWGKPRDNSLKPLVRDVAQAFLATIDTLGPAQGQAEIRRSD
jgi:hypothetical protein